jgi:hypothetical protein
VRNAAAQQQPTSQAMTAKSPVDDTISAVNACVQCFAVVQASLGEKIRVAENGFSQEKYCHAFAPKFHVRVPAPTTHKSKMFCKKQQNEKEKEVFAALHCWTLQHMRGCVDCRAAAGAGTTQCLGVWVDVCAEAASVAHASGCEQLGVCLASNVPQRLGGTEQNTFSSR